MDFVDERIIDLRPALAVPAVRLLRGPHLGAEHFRFRILHAARGIGRNALSPTAGPFHIPFIQIAVRNPVLRDAQLPVPFADRLQGPFLAPSPAVEVAGQIEFRRIGRPLAEHPRPFLPVQTIIQGTVDGRLQGLAIPRNLLLAQQDLLVAPLDHLRKRLEPRVFLPDFHQASSSLSFISFSISSWLQRM